jgi:hypothetical protein
MHRCDMKRSWLILLAATWSSVALMAGRDLPAAESIDIDLTRWTPPDISCACRKLNPGISVMESAQDWATKNVSGAIDGARDRCIFLQG